MRRHDFPLNAFTHAPLLLRRAAMLALALMLSLPAALSEEETKSILAIVNGTALPIEDAQRQFDYYAPLYDEFDQGDALDALRREMARSAVRRFLILSDCRRLGLEMDDAEKAALRLQTDAEFQRILHAQLTVSPDDEQAGLTLAVAEVCLARNGITAETLFTRAVEETLISRHREFVTGDIYIDEDSLYAAFEERASLQKAAYEQDPARFEHDLLCDEIICCIPEGTRRILHMLILADADDQRALEACLSEYAHADECDRDALTEQLYTLAAPLLERAAPLTQRLQNGESMATLMALYEDDSRILSSPWTSRECCYVARDGSLWEEPLRSAAQSLEKVGDFSEPIVTALGVHLIQLAELPSAGNVVDYASVRSRLEEELTAEARRAAYESTISALFDAADILWYDDNLAYPDEVD